MKQAPCGNMSRCKIITYLGMCIVGQSKLFCTIFVLGFFVELFWLILSSSDRHHDGTTLFHDVFSWRVKMLLTNFIFSFKAQPSEVKICKFISNWHKQAKENIVVQLLKPVGHQSAFLLVWTPSLFEVVVKPYKPLC